MAEFTGVFTPKEILSIKELNLTEKMLLSQIIPLCVSEPCYASNQFFAERLGITETTVSTTLKSLDDKGYLQTLLDRRAGNKRVIEIFYYNDTLFKNFKDPSLKTLNTLFKNLKDPLKNSYIPYLKNLKTLFKNLNFIYKDESKEESKEESKGYMSNDANDDKGENFEISKNEDLEQVPDFVTANRKKITPLVGGRLDKESLKTDLMTNDYCRMQASRDKVPKESYEPVVDFFIEQKFGLGENEKWKDLADARRNFTNWIPFYNSNQQKPNEGFSKLTVNKGSYGEPKPDNRNRNAAF